MEDNPVKRLGSNDAGTAELSVTDPASHDASGHSPRPDPPQPMDTSELPAAVDERGDAWKEHETDGTDHFDASNMAIRSFEGYGDEQNLRGKEVLETTADKEDIEMADRDEAPAHTEEAPGLSEREEEKEQYESIEQTQVPPQPIWRDYKEKFILKGHQRGVSCVKFSPDGSMIASSSADATIKIWGTTTGRLIHTFEGHLAGISTITWSPDSSMIASGADDKSIRIWHVSTGKPHPIPLLGHHNYIYSIAWSPKGNILVSGSYDEAVFLWDVRSARVLRSLPAHSDPVAGIDVVHDGTLVASCASDGLIRIWDTATGQCLRTLVHEDNPPVSSVKFSPNGKYVLAWSHDDCVRLWDYVEGKCIKTYQGHRNKKYSLCGTFGVYGGRTARDEEQGTTSTATTATAPNAEPIAAFAVSGSEDSKIICWDVVSKRILQAISNHRDIVLAVDASPGQNINGQQRLLVSGGLDKTVRVWEENQDDATQEGEKGGEEDLHLNEDTPKDGQAQSGENMNR